MKVKLSVLKQLISEAAQEELAVQDESVNRVRRHEDGRGDSLFDEANEPSEEEQDADERVWSLQHPSKPLVKPGEEFTRKFGAEKGVGPSSKTKKEGDDFTKTVVLPHNRRADDKTKIGAYNQKFKQVKQAGIKNVANQHKSDMGKEGWKFKKDPGGWSAKIGDKEMDEAAVGSQDPNRPQQSAQSSAALHTRDKSQIQPKGNAPDLRNAFSGKNDLDRPAQQEDHTSHSKESGYSNEIEEAAPPRKQAEEMLRKAKPSFQKKYGKDYQKYLVASLKKALKK